MEAPATPSVRLMKPLHLRRYDELTFPMAHDCHCVGDPKDWTFKEKVMKLHSCTQTRGPAEQVRDGIRAFRINTCYWKGSVRLNHGPPIAQYVFPVQTVFGALEEFLETLSHFLKEEKNSRKVLTIFDEGDCPVDKIIPVYEKVFGDLTKWLLQRTDGTAFNAVGDMVTDGARLVVWMRQVDKDRAVRPQEVRLREACDVRFRLFHGFWGSNVWQNPWCVYDQKHSEYAIWPEDMTANKYRGAGNKQSPLYLYNHLFYTDGMNELPAHLKFIINRAAGHFETSDYCKSHLAVGPLLNYDTIKAWKVTRRRPNFVNGVKGAHSNLFSLVSSMNHTELLVPPTVPYPVTAVSIMRVPTVGLVIVFAAAGELYLSVPGTDRPVMRLTVPDGSRFKGKLRIFAVDEEGHLCAGRVSFEVSLPLAAIAPILDERMMSSMHFVADIAPAAVQYRDKIAVAARLQPEKDQRSKLVAFYEKSNGTWHTHSFGFSSLASPSLGTGIALVRTSEAVWAFALAEEGMMVAWRGVLKEAGGIEWEQKQLSEALFEPVGSPCAFAISDLHILVLGFSPSKQIVLQRFNTKRCGWGRTTKVLQLANVPTGLKGPLVCHINENTLTVGAMAECADMQDPALNLKGLAAYAATLSPKSLKGEWRLSSPALVQCVSGADALTGAVYYIMQDAPWATMAFEEDV